MSPPTHAAWMTLVHVSWLVPAAAARRRASRRGIPPRLSTDGGSACHVLIVCAMRLASSAASMACASRAPSKRSGAASGPGVGAWAKVRWTMPSRRARWTVRGMSRRGPSAPLTFVMRRADESCFASDEVGEPVRRAGAKASEWATSRSESGRSSTIVRASSGDGSLERRGARPAEWGRASARARTGTSERPLSSVNTRPSVASRYTCGAICSVEVLTARASCSGLTGPA